MPSEVFEEKETKSLAKPPAFDKEKYLEKFQDEYKEYVDIKEEFEEVKEVMAEKQKSMVEWQQFFFKNGVDLESDYDFE